MTTSGKMRPAAGLLFLLLATLAAAQDTALNASDRAARLLRLARDTHNPADYRMAGEVAAKVLAGNPQNFDAQRFEAAALLGQGDSAGALALASQLNKRVPDDIGIWALLSEINVARGDYAEAERCAQWVLDLRRNSPVGFRAAAQLREVSGDYEGAADFYAEALRRTPQSDAEERSWLMVQSARTLIRQNKFAAAASFLDQAAKLFPGSLQVRDERVELAHAAEQSELKP